VVFIKCSVAGMGRMDGPGPDLGLSVQLVQGAGMAGAAAFAPYIAPIPSVR
jgi:hypothetical protein